MRVVAAFALWVLAAVPAAAQSASVFYFHAYGDWAVFCQQDMVSAQKSCFMNTPPPRVIRPFARLSVQITAAGPQINVQVFRPYPGRGPFGLSVDDAPPVPAPANRWGEAQWSGDAAVRLLARMTTGTAMTLRIGDTIAPLSLSGLPDTLQAYQALRRTHGL